MGDIQCAARFCIVRHTEAERSGSPNDQTGPGLTGPGLTGPGLTEQGKQQARMLAEQLRAERVADVFTSTMARARQTGQIIAEQLGTTAADLPGVEEVSAWTVPQAVLSAQAHGTIEAWWRGAVETRLPDGPSGIELAGRFASAIEDCADSYRGETVLVVSHGGIMSLALAQLARRPDVLGAHWIAHGGIAQVDVDDDGWALRQWPGSSDPTHAA